MNKVADLCILNIICLVCCIPIVTAGASITAMYYVTLKMVRNEEAYIVRSFFKSFKDIPKLWNFSLLSNKDKNCFVKIAKSDLS